jgi:putative transposase
MFPLLISPPHHLDPALQLFSAKGAALYQPRATPWVTVPLDLPRAKGPIYLCRMPQSLSLVIVHIIFSTKDRAEILDKDMSRELYLYLSAVARNQDCECFRAGGVTNHVHLAVRLSRTMTQAKLIEELKTSSSKWIKQRSPQLRNCSWQRGYGAFSVGPSDLPALLAYIDTQEEHHRKHSFEDELRTLLKKYGVEHDERHMWD